MNEGDKVPVEGKLTFRGYDIYDLLSDTSPSKRYGFEEVAYLLMLCLLYTSADRRKEASPAKYLSDSMQLGV